MTLAGALHTAPPVQTVTSPRRAAVLLHPLRLRLLSLAREPVSATELARRVALPRQRVNYHVRALERAGFLRAAGRRRRRNLIEQRYVATARFYVLAPELLGPLAADWRAIPDTASADYLLALIEHVRSDVSRAAAPAAAGQEPATILSVKSQFRFETGAERVAFAEAIRRSLVEVIARHSSPNRLENGQPGRGRPYRLVLACYPAPAEEAEAPKGG